MPNLLKSLPREILEKEDSKFIYNVLNPLLFDKIKDSDIDTTVTHAVSRLLEKDINYNRQFLPEFLLPYNINSREFHVYMTDGQENKKIEYFGKTELVKELDDLKAYIFFYFAVDGYTFLEEITKKYYYIINEYEKNKSLYEYNYKKYLEAVDIKKKKVFKSTYEYFKDLYDMYSDLKTEFNLIFIELQYHNEYSINQLVDNFSRALGDHLDIKTFDNEIIFENSKLFAFLNETLIIPTMVDKHIFSGKNILSTTSYSVSNVYELIAIFAMEFSSIKVKYDDYLKLLVDNGNGYALEKSSDRKLKNEVYSNIVVDLSSDNLTYFVNEAKNELEIYLFFLKDFRIDESTIDININDRKIPASIHSLNGQKSYGYTIFEYFDDETKYYKITVHDYLLYDLDGNYINYDIESLNITLSAVKSIYQIPNSSQELNLETAGFLDNFVLYKKNTQTGFYEVMNVPFKLKVGIEEKEERYTRTYEFMGIDAGAHQELISQSEIIIGCYDYDYLYEPKLYVDFFKYSNNTINIRFNTIIPYVLIDDILDNELELVYYTAIPTEEYSTNIHKNIIMYDGKTYRKTYDDINNMKILNPYNESNYDYVSKITYGMYKERTHTNAAIILDTIKKIPFRDNLNLLDKLQFDKTRNMVMFMHQGVQKAVPLHEGLERGLNFEQLHYNFAVGKLEYCGEELCSEGFRFLYDGIYLKNPITNEYDLIEATPTEQINLSVREKEIFFDMFEMAHCVILDGKKYKIGGLYVDTYLNALQRADGIMFVESKYGIPRYKTPEGNIIDVDFSRPILDGETPTDGAIIYDRIDNELVFRNTIVDTYTMTLIELEVKTNKHRQLGMTAFSIFYAGNVLPENSNKTFFGRENIYNSMFMADNIYKIGRSVDIFNNSQQHELLAEQLDLKASDAAKYNMEEESYLMFKSATSSLKGLESYLKSNLKSISQDIGVSPVYLIQRNRFISEWARVSGVMPESVWAKDALKDLVADLMETKLLNNSYDDLMDIFKNNEYEKFSIDTNNIHNILVQYILRFVEEEFLAENLTYYLIHNVWIGNNRKKIIDFIKLNADEQTIREVSAMTFATDYEKEQLFYIFVRELEKINKVTISTYLPLANYSDWELYNLNNHVKFEKPYSYDVIDISDFITMPIEWKQPLYLIRPLTEDGVFTKRDYRFLDLSMATNSQITYDDAYNEYVEDIKNKLNRPVDYLDETLRALNDLSITNGFDLMGVNLVIIKWIVERHLPTYIMSNTVEDVETFKQVIIDELTSAEHPNMIVSYNKIKEITLLGDLGSNINEIYNTIINGGLVVNSTIRLDITSSIELEYLDKIKRPLEHYFDYLFWVGRYDIVTKVLALFTEDVIATSMIDLSFAINVKNTKGDETFDIYEQMIFEIFDEFLPFHTVLDKIIFTIKIMETASGEAISKQADVGLTDTTLIEIMLDFAEKIRIQTIDKTIISARISTLFPTEGLKLSGGHDEIPYDYDRTIKAGGHGLPLHMDDFEAYGVDDDWYIINRETWKQRTADVYTPPEFASLIWESIPEGEFEKIVDTYINDYYHIKTDIFERDDRIESHFVDFVPTLSIEQGVTENPEINVTEDYLIAIDTTFNIRFYNMEEIGHDDYGLDTAWGPEDQTTLIGMKEAIQQNILQDFYDKINVSVMDSIWSDVVVVYDLTDIPGHDDFAVDEYYHQRPPELLGQEISVMAYDGLLTQGFEITARDMSDISLVDEKLAYAVAADYRELILDTVVSDTFHVTVDIITNRHFDSEGHFLRPAHDEFAYDEYYHNSADYDRIANMIDTMAHDLMGDIRVDFGFMRMLPIDPYADLIKQKFYRANLPGSDWQKTRVRDSMRSNINIFGKDIIRVGLMDLYTLDLIAEDTRRKVYEDIESEAFGGDWFTSSIADSLIKRHIHHDFRENILAIDKYATILSDEDILNIYGTRAANFERDELFKLELGDTLYSSIKVKHPVERSTTKIDRDYLKSIKIEDENFTEFKYMDNNIEVRFSDTMRSFMAFNDRASIVLKTIDKTLIGQYNKEDDLKIELLDKVHYGQRNEFEIEGMKLGISDALLEMWSNKIHKDSAVISVTEIGQLETAIDLDYNFDIRAIQPHAEYGHMGYTEESIDRSIESRLKDSLVQVSTESYFVGLNAELYDGMMHDVAHYFGEFIDVVISDSLKTYVDIVRKPWIMPEYDNFGHDEYPHMYNGESDEFDISTELRDSMKIDSYTKLYDVGAYTEVYDRIYMGHHYILEGEKSSVSMSDDLKVISVGFKDVFNLSIRDVTDIQKDAGTTDVQVTVQDTIWYGYKLRDEETYIHTADLVSYWYEDEDQIRFDSANVGLRDWLFFNYTFIDDKPNIELVDTLTYAAIGAGGKDNLSIALKDSLTIHELRDITFLADTAKVYIKDKLFVNEAHEITTDADMIDKDTLRVGFKEDLQYGPGKKFIEPLRVFALNRINILDKGYEFIPDVFIHGKDSFHEYTTIAPFKDYMGVDTYERMKFGPIFKDKVNVLVNEGLDVRLLFLDDRYGMDMMPHTESAMEYYNDAIDRAMTAVVKDDIKILDTHLTFGDSLIILSNDQLATQERASIFQVDSKSDGIVIQSGDNLMYGTGIYDYIWDAKEWEHYGYEVPYEDWIGHIPHDEFPYDEMSHQDQGDDLAQINTGVTENLFYGFDFLFKETLTIKTNDKGGFSHWGYQSVFKDSVMVGIDNRLETDYIAGGDNNNTMVNFRNEIMTVQYEFDDKVKKHTFLGVNNELSTEEINIYDIETHQLLETIMKYRIYEEIDASINSNLLTSSLFKYDDELSLVTDYRTKIDLYKAQADGSIQRSMTVIKDKSTAKVELIFSDGIAASMKDRLHGTEALRPNEYLD